MGKREDLRLQKYNIGVNAYRELLYFCRQYAEKKSQLALLRDISAAAYDGMPRSGKVSTPTEDRAIRAAQLERDCEMIERAAHEADPALAKYLLLNVTQDRLPYEYLNVPAGRRNFYEKRRRFFYCLAKEKGMI